MVYLMPSLTGNDYWFRDLLQFSRDLLYRFDLIRGRMEYVGGGVKTLTGYGAELFAGDSPQLDWTALIHPEDLPAVFAARKAACAVPVAARQGQPVPCQREYRIRVADGSWRWCGDNGAVLFDEQGRPATLVGSVRDITDRKAAEAHLQDQRNRLQAIMDAIEEHINIMDLDGNVIWHNRGMQGPDHSALGRKCWEAFEKRATRCPHCTHPDILRDGRPREYEGVTDSKLENPTYWWVRAIPMRNAQGEIYAILETAINITARKKIEREKMQMEARLMQAQKLESLGILAGGIAHDFNNLLGAILGNADLALGKTPADAPVRRHLQAIEAASRRAADLCHQMLAYSGRGKARFAAVNINDVVREMSGILEISVGKSVTLHSRLADPLPAVLADATQVRQVVMNLITNAGEAIGRRPGIICVTTGAMECDAGFISRLAHFHDIAPGRYAFVEVADTGCGMSPETVKKIYDPFFTTKFTGRGLGMAVVFGIVRSHRGFIKLDSTPGTGTIFRVGFPLNAAVPIPAETVRAEPPASPAPREKRGTVLLVDDEELVRGVAEKMLELAGFSVLTAEDGPQAVACFREHAGEIACVVLDYTMPNMTGDEVFRELRALRPDVRVLLTSGYSAQDAFSRGAQDGLAGFLQKPYDSDTLVRAVAAAIGPAGPPPA